MPDWISSLFSVHKVPFKVLAWVSLVSGVLLFAPNWFRVKLGLEPFVKAQGTYIGIVFLAAASLVVINAAGWLVAKVAKRLVYGRWKRNLQSVVGGLDHAEKAVLREFAIQGKNTIDLPMDNATVVGLENKGILRREGDHGIQILAGFVFPYGMQDEVRPLLSDEILGLPRGRALPEQVEQLRRSRPAFIADIERHRDLLRW